MTGCHHRLNAFDLPRRGKYCNTPGERVRLHHDTRGPWLPELCPVHLAYYLDRGYRRVARLEIVR